MQSLVGYFDSFANFVVAGISGGIGVRRQDIHMIERRASDIKRSFRTDYVNTKNNTKKRKFHWSIDEK